MPNQRDLQLDKYKISKNRYRELKYFCLQYEEKKKALSVFRERKDLNCQEALKLQKDIEMIERTAIEADSSIYKQIIKNVTQGIQPEHMPMPCGRKYFYKIRSRFFCILDIKNG